MSRREERVLFLGKAGDAHAARALDFCRTHFTEVSAHLGTWGDALPDEAREWRGDCIVSYLSRWIVPGEMLDRASVAINFHPGPPQYPGYGCNAFAIYDDAKEYGVTCHHMAGAVDSGAIVAVRRFAVLPSDNGGTLLERAYDYQLTLFYEVTAQLARGEKLPAAQEGWTRKPYTRREFHELGRITPDMAQQEIARRIRAATIGPWKPRLELQGHVFELKTPEAG